jgi:hypothetical protein
MPAPFWPAHTSTKHDSTFLDLRVDLGNSENDCGSNYMTDILLSYLFKQAEYAVETRSQGFVKVLWEKCIVQYANDICMVILSRYGEWVVMELTTLDTADQWKPVARYVLSQLTERMWYPLASGYEGAYVTFGH